jgi:hypothetical protein
MPEQHLHQGYGGAALVIEQYSFNLFKRHLAEKANRAYFASGANTMTPYDMTMRQPGQNGHRHQAQVNFIFGKLFCKRRWIIQVQADALSHGQPLYPKKHWPGIQITYCPYPDDLFQLLCGIFAAQMSGKPGA